ncbi:MAG: tRNA glutamyl-Q(34) synthetase GluQRS [Alphaproteobacteria bacterium]|nr:tRNA glutamyl-Q(34) synthetase GluQRS [Alphaproteobacteria bacterium]
MTKDVTRFAPSPTGFLHLGHAFAALFAARAAQDSSGRFLLRIEDIDLTRARGDFEVAIDEDLAWLGLSWERPVRRQSENFADYASALDRLKTQRLIYPCFCTRREIASEIAESVLAPQGPDGPLYPGTCRNRSSMEREERIESGEQHAWRLDVERCTELAGSALTFNESGLGPRGESGAISARPEIFGDVVLARKETPASYHLAVVVDDALQGVTLVTRGNDLFQATHLHRLLQALLDLPVPRYRHHRLITDASGKRLAKRDAATALRALRAEGWTAARVYDELGFTNR